MTSNPLPVIGPIPQALLLCSRETLSPRQEEHIVSLCGAIDDWPAFVEQAEFRLVLPLVHRHLARLRPAAVPASVMDTLKERAMRIVMRTFTLASVHGRLAREVFEPLHIPYVFTKGLTLAYRYYREPGLRMARDIDVLVNRRDRARVGHRLRQLGFNLYGHGRVADDHAVHFADRFADQMLWSPGDGVWIEVHRSIQSQRERFRRERFPADEIIAAAEAVTIGGVEVAVMRELDQFEYLCFHHARHHWARLHWIADLEAIVRSPGFCLSSARDHARRRGRGSERTIDAAIAVNRAAALPEPWTASFDDPFAREIFWHCLKNLEGDFAMERSLRSAFPTGYVDLAPRRRWLHDIARRVQRRIEPKSADYRQLPLHHRWHSAYYALRPFLWTIRKLRGAGRRR